MPASLCSVCMLLFVRSDGKTVQASGWSKIQLRETILLDHSIDSLLRSKPVSVPSPYHLTVDDGIYSHTEEGC